MIKRIRKALLIVTLIIVLFSCCNNATQEPSVSEILRNFNWLADDGNHENEYRNKPFLQKNADGNNGAAGVLDINHDGEPEFLMAAYHIPRGIPSVEVFTIKNDQLQSIGGFFEGRENPRKLSYYRDEQGRPLFLQETQSHYGGITTTLVATYTDTDGLKSVPIAGSQKNYYESEDFPDYYYVFPDDMAEECTNHGLCVAFSDSAIDYSATEEEYNARIAGFMSTLTWIEDVEYDYAAYYHLYNYHELPIEIRGKEIAEGLKMSPPKDFNIPEEIKKTSNMVADALYQSYCNRKPA